MTLSGKGVVGPLSFSKFPLSDHGVHTKIVQTPRHNSGCKLWCCDLWFFWMKFGRIETLVKYTLKKHVFVDKIFDDHCLKKLPSQPQSWLMRLQFCVIFLPYPVVIIYTLFQFWYFKFSTQFALSGRGLDNIWFSNLELKT